MIHLFNITGRTLFADYFIYENKIHTENRIDLGDYNSNELVEIKVPLNNPYYSSTPGYERYYGEGEWDGRAYNYVMRKVMNDTVYIVCLENHDRQNLQKAKNNLISDTDATTGKKGSDPAAKKQLPPGDYCQPVYDCLATACSCEMGNMRSDHDASANPGIVMSSDRPPESSGNMSTV